MRQVIPEWAVVHFLVMLFGCICMMAKVGGM
jgi:hypothetical protein